MFNTPFAFNSQFTPFGYNGFQSQGFQGQGFNGWNPSWNQSFNTPFSGFGAQSSWNSTPWSASSSWNSTPWNWNQSFNTPFNGYQGFNGFNGFSPFWNQSSPAWNWNNAPAAFAGQFPSQYPTPFGFNWWNAENTQSEAAAPFAGAPFAGFNPHAAPVNQAA